VITLNAPERHNALTPGMAGRLVEVCEAIDAEPTAGAAIIQGAGGHFCAVAHRDVLRAAERDPADSASYADNSAVFGALYRFGQLAVYGCQAPRPCLGQVFRPKRSRRTRWH